MVNKTKILAFLLLLMISIGLVACSNDESSEELESSGSKDTEEQIDNDELNLEKDNEEQETEAEEDVLADYSAQEIEYARVWIQLGGNTEELEQLNVRHIEAGTEIAPQEYFDFSMPEYPEDVIQLTGVRLVDGIVTYSGNGDGTVNVYNIPTRFDRSGEMSDEEYVEYWEETLQNTETVYIEPGDSEEVIQFIELLHYNDH